MPDENELESATNLALALAWVTGAVVAAYLLGVVLTWVLMRIGRRSTVICDIAELTRMPVRAALVVFGSSIAVQRTSDPDDSWRGWLDHTLQILLIAALTWLLPAWCSSPNAARSPGTAAVTWRSSMRTANGGGSARR